MLQCDALVYIHDLLSGIENLNGTCPTRRLYEPTGTERQDIVKPHERASSWGRGERLRRYNNRAACQLAQRGRHEMMLMRQVRSVIFGGHKLSWVAQGLTDEDGNVVVEEQLGFCLDGQPVSDSQGETILSRLAYV